MDEIEKVPYWQKECAYFRRKYGKNSIEAKGARLNLAIARQAWREYAAEKNAELEPLSDCKTLQDWSIENDPDQFWG